MRFFTLFLIFWLNACGSDSGSPGISIPADSPCGQKTETSGTSAGTPVALALVDEKVDEKCPIEQAKNEISKATTDPTATPTTVAASTTTTATSTASTTATATPAATTTTTSNTCTSNATRTKYQASSVSYGQTCSSETQTALCTNGTLEGYSGTFTFDACSVEAAAACGAISHGASGTRTRYQASSVSYGSSCSSETQTATCSNGSFGSYSGTYTAESCSVQAPGNCGAVLHGQNASRTKYQAASVASGNSCVQQTQTALCTNGTLGSYSGTYTFDSCSVDDPAACGATANGLYASRTRYSTSSVAYGSTCSSESQQALCTNGTLGSYSGSYTYDSCTVNAPAACGGTAHGGTVSRTKYQAATVAYGSTCSSETQSATCNNGSFGSYSGTYTFDSCSVNSPANCGGTIHGDSISRTRYQNLTVAWNASCTSESQTSTCSNGTMGAYTGTYTYVDCAVRNRYFEEALDSVQANIKTLSGLKTDGTTVLIAGLGGLVASANMTNSFTTHAGGSIVRAFQIDPTTHDWFATFSTYWTRYRINGGVWSTLSSAPNSLNTGSGQISVLVKDLYSASTKVWAATPDGIYYSSDTGVTFTLKTAEPARSIFKSVSGALIVNTDSNGLIMYNQTTYAVYRAFTTTTGLPSNQVNASWCNNSVSTTTSKWVVGTPSGVALSTDGGNNWTVKTTANGLPSNNILSVYVPNLDGQTIYLGTEGGLAISTDGGANWTTRYLAADANINGIITYGSDIWMTSSTWGLWKLQ